MNKNNNTKIINTSKILKAKEVKSESVAMALLEAIVRARRARNLVVLGILLIGLTACGAQVRIPGSQGYVHMEGEKEIKAFFDGQNGMITNGKASADKDTAHWATRRAQEAEVTRRDFAPSLLDKLMGNQVTVPTAAAPVGDGPTSEVSGS